MSLTELRIEDTAYLQHQVHVVDLMVLQQYFPAIIELLVIDLYIAISLLPNKQFSNLFKVHKLQRFLDKLFSILEGTRLLEVKLRDGLKYHARKTLVLDQRTVTLLGFLFRSLLRPPEVINSAVKNNFQFKEFRNKGLNLFKAGNFWFGSKESGSLAAEGVFELIWQQKMLSSKMFQYKKQMEEYENYNPSTGQGAPVFIICYHYMENFQLILPMRNTNQELLMDQGRIGLLSSTATTDQDQDNWNAMFCEGFEQMTIMGKRNKKKKKSWNIYNSSPSVGYIKDHMRFLYNVAILEICHVLKIMDVKVNKETSVKMTLYTNQVFDIWLNRRTRVIQEDVCQEDDIKMTNFDTNEQQDADDGDQVGVVKVHGFCCRVFCWRLVMATYTNKFLCVDPLYLGPVDHTDILIGAESDYEKLHKWKLVLFTHILHPISALRELQLLWSYSCYKGRDLSWSTGKNGQIEEVKYIPSLVSDNSLEKQTKTKWWRDSFKSRKFKFTDIPRSNVLHCGKGEKLISITRNATQVLLKIGVKMEIYLCQVFNIMLGKIKKKRKILFWSKKRSLIRRTTIVNSCLSGSNVASVSHLNHISSSTKLLLQEDIKSGVYVGNFTECDTVHNILELITQRSLNQRVEALSMGRESRSLSFGSANTNFAEFQVNHPSSARHRKRLHQAGNWIVYASRKGVSISQKELKSVEITLLDIREFPSHYIPHRWTKNADFGWIHDMESCVSAQALKANLQVDEESAQLRRQITYACYFSYLFRKVQSLVDATKNEENIACFEESKFWEPWRENALELVLCSAFQWTFIVVLGYGSLPKPPDDGFSLFFLLQVNPSKAHSFVHHHLIRPLVHIFQQNSSSTRAWGQAQSQRGEY